MLETNYIISILMCVSNGLVGILYPFYPKIGISHSDIVLMYQISVSIRLHKFKLKVIIDQYKAI